MNRYGSVYVVTNTHTGERYVGQTRQKTERRWKCHINTAVSKVAPKYKLAQAIGAFGKDVFLFEEVFVAFDKDILNAVEVAVIAELKPEYNITKGGAGHSGVVASEAVRKGRSERLKQRWSDPVWRDAQVKKIREFSQTPEAIERGRKLAEKGRGKRWLNHTTKTTTPADRSEAIKKSWLDPQTRAARIAGLRKTFEDPEKRANISARLEGRKLSKESISKVAQAKWKPIYCKELQCSFLSQKAASEFLGVLRTSISNAVKRKGRVAGKYTLEQVA